MPANTNIISFTQALDNGARERDYFFDNLKFILIVFVSIGHALFFCGDEAWVKGLRHFIYTFHMPLFILVAGYFTRRARSSSLLTVLYQYLVFQTLYWAFFKFVLHQDWGTGGMPQYTIPIVVLWFLPAMLFWKIIAPLAEKLKYPVPITLGFALLIAFDRTIERPLALAPAISFLPFFMLGYTRSRSVILGVKNVGRTGQILALILACGVLALSFSKYAFPPELLYGYTPQKLNVVSAIIAHVTLFGVSLFMLSFVVLFTPERKLWFTRFGSRTLQIYLLHDIIFRIPVIRDTFAPNESAVRAILFLGLAVVLPFVLATKPFYWLTLPFVKPEWVGKVRSRK